MSLYLKFGGHADTVLIQSLIKQRIISRVNSSAAQHKLFDEANDSDSDA